MIQLVEAYVCRDSEANGLLHIYEIGTPEMVTCHWRWYPEDLIMTAYKWEEVYDAEVPVTGSCELYDIEL